MKIIISFGIFLIFTTTATCNLKVENEDRVIGKFEIVDLPNMFLICVVNISIITNFTDSFSGTEEGKDDLGRDGKLCKLYLSEFKLITPFSRLSRSAELKNRFN